MRAGRFWKNKCLVDTWARFNLPLTQLIILVSYLQIVRLILREGIEKGLIFADSKDKLAYSYSFFRFFFNLTLISIPYSLSTEQMSLIDGDDSLKQADKILSEFGISSTDNERSIGISSSWKFLNFFNALLTAHLSSQYVAFVKWFRAVLPAWLPLLSQEF